MRGTVFVHVYRYETVVFSPNTALLPTTRLSTPLDLRRELEEKKHFYLPSALLPKKKEYPLPGTIFSFTNIGNYDVLL